MRDDVGSDHSKNREGSVKWSGSKQLSKMKQTVCADGLAAGRGRKSECKDFSRVTPVFRARAITAMGKAWGEAGLKGGRGVWLDSETLGT